MAGFPAWTWLFSGASGRQPRRSPASRPCIAAVEVLDDRVLLSSSAATTAAAAAPPPASDQAVGTFLKWQDDYIKFMDGVVATEQKLLKLSDDQLKASDNELKLSGTQMTPSDAEYFLKLDGDLLKIAGDLTGGQAPAGSAGATSGADAAAPSTVGGIDGTIIGFNNKFSGRAGSDADRIQTDLKLMMQVDALLIKILAGGDNGGSGATDAVDSYLKLEAIKLKEQAAATVLNATFLKLETAFVGSDLEESIDSLGGDLSPLTTDAAPQNTPAFDAFLKFEEDFLKVQDSFLKIEDQFLKLQGQTSGDDSQSSPAAVDYFLKLDADYLKIDVDLAGTPPSTTAASDSVVVTNGGINDVLIKGNLPADVIAEIENKWSPILFKAQAQLNADIAALKAPVAGNAPGAAGDDGDQGVGGYKEQIARATAALDANFLKFEADFMEGDPDRPLVDNLLTDLNTLAADAALKTSES